VCCLPLRQRASSRTPMCAGMGTVGLRRSRRSCPALLPAELYHLAMMETPGNGASRSAAGPAQPKPTSWRGHSVDGGRQAVGPLCSRLMRRGRAPPPQWRCHRPHLLHPQQQRRRGSIMAAPAPQRGKLPQFREFSLMAAEFQPVASHEIVQPQQELRT
jgi:hypothetical protein